MDRCPEAVHASAVRDDRTPRDRRQALVDYGTHRSRQSARTPAGASRALAAASAEATRSTKAIGEFTAVQLISTRTMVYRFRQQTDLKCASNWLGDYRYHEDRRGELRDQHRLNAERGSAISASQLRIHRADDRWNHDELGQQQCQHKSGQYARLPDPTPVWRVVGLAGSEPKPASLR